MADSYRERTFDLEVMNRSYWRSRISQLKRELRDSDGRAIASPSNPMTSPAGAPGAMGMGRRLPKRGPTGRAGGRNWEQRRSLPPRQPLASVEPMAASQL